MPSYMAAAYRVPREPVFFMNTDRGNYQPIRTYTSEALPITPTRTPVLPGDGIRRRTPMYPAITTFSLN